MSQRFRRAVFPYAASLGGLARSRFHAEDDGKRMSDIVSIFYPEKGRAAFHVAMAPFNSINGFTLCCVHTRLYLILAPARGAAYYQDPSFYRKSLRNLQGEGRRVVGVDVDPVVSTNPYIDEAVVIDAASPLPFPKDTLQSYISGSQIVHRPTLAVTIAGAQETPKGWYFRR